MAKEKKIKKKDRTIVISHEHHLLMRMGKGEKNNGKNKKLGSTKNSS
jgi:hypothetical protein